MRSRVSSLRQHAWKLLTGEGLRGSYTLPHREVETPMTDADYREMASGIRELIPLLMHPGTLPDTPLEYRRQAG
jgi:hypothetical protein